MTNEQLVWLFKIQKQRLVEIADDIKNNLPDEMAVEHPGFFGQPFKKYPILEGLESFIAHVQDDIDLLSPTNNDGGR